MLRIRARDTRANRVQQFEDADLALAIGDFGDLHQLLSGPFRSCDKRGLPQRQHL